MDEELASTRMLLQLGQMAETMSRSSAISSASLPRVRTRLLVALTEVGVAVGHAASGGRGRAGHGGGDEESGENRDERPSAKHRRCSFRMGSLRSLDGSGERAQT